MKHSLWALLAFASFALGGVALGGGCTRLFNGKALTGWEGLIDGEIIGKAVKGPDKGTIGLHSEYGRFEFCKIRLKEVP